MEVVGRLTTFTKALTTAVATDSELSAWLTSCKAKIRLTPGLLISVYRRWSVRIAPEVREPYLSRWKAHIVEQLRRTSGAPRTRQARSQALGRIQAPQR